MKHLLTSEELFKLSYALDVARAANLSSSAILGVLAVVWDKSILAREDFFSIVSDTIISIAVKEDVGMDAGGCRWYHN